MKKKIGEIYNKPIVIGNPNEFNKNEVALSELGGDSFYYGVEYYLIEEGTSIPPMAVLHCICRHPIDQKCGLYTASNADKEVIAVAIPTTLYAVPDMTAKDVIADALNNAKQITAKEYYSLLD